MLVYSISSLLELADKLSEISVSLPFLESFAGKYSQKVTEDRKTPLFSKTSKYNNFPVRCQWKSGGADRGNHKNDRRREKPKMYDRFQPKDEWRKENGAAESSTERMVPTKIRKVSGIKGLAIKVLNKITENNFNKQANELLKVLLENKEKNSVNIIANLILEKIWYDKGFYKLYINLCKKLWENDEWVSECYQIHRVEKGSGKSSMSEYFYSLNFKTTNKPVLKGPYNSNKLALEKAKKMVNFKSIFISLCRDNFYKRHIFITEAACLPDSTKKYKLKRRLFGTVEILGHFCSMGHLDENIIHFILLSLMHTDNIHNNGAKYPEEIEAFKLLWDIVNSKIGSTSMREYTDILRIELTRDWGSRINFMLEDMIESVGAVSTKSTFFRKQPNVKDVSKAVFTPKSTSNSHMRITRKVQSLTVPASWDKNDSDNCTESEVSDEVDEKDEKITNDIVKLSRHYNDDNKEDMLEMLKTAKKMSEFSTNVVSSIIKDSTEYGEYAESHSSTILSWLNNYNISNLSFENLSEAITLACEDIGDLKIDAPKAPKNMSFVIGKILKGTKTGKIEININKTNIEHSDPSENKKEWDNIFKLTENFIDKDTLTTRFEILKYNN